MISRNIVLSKASGLWYIFNATFNSMPGCAPILHNMVLLLSEAAFILEYVFITSE